MHMQMGKQSGSHAAHSNATVVRQTSPFCYGAGMAMHMGGMESETFGSPVDCLNFIFGSWTLDTMSKFWAACFATLIFGFALEVLGYARRSYRRRGGRLRRPGTPLLSRVGQRIGYFFLYGLERFGLYVAMLISMS